MWRRGGQCGGATEGGFRRRKYKTREVTGGGKVEQFIRLSNPRSAKPRTWTSGSDAILRARALVCVGGKYGYGAGEESRVSGTSQIRERCGRAAASQRAAGGFGSIVFEILILRRGYRAHHPARCRTARAISGL